MSLDLFLVRFSNGHFDPIPMAEAEPVLKLHGEIVGSVDELLSFCPPETNPIAVSIGISCKDGRLCQVHLLRPCFGPHLSAFLFDLMQQLGMALFFPDGPALVAGDRRAHLPDDYRKDAVVVASADEIFPEPLA